MFKSLNVRMNSIGYLFLLVIWDVYSCSKMSQTEQLLKDLTTNYNPDLRPGINNYNPLIVNISLNLVALTKINEVKGYISTVQFFDITWMDKRMSWKPELYEDINHFTVRANTVWRPELIIANPADKMYAIDEFPSTVRFYSSGLALWRPGLVSKTLSNFETPSYPFDEHVCVISVIVWGSLPSEIIIQSPLNAVSTGFYNGNAEWTLTGCSSVTYQDDYVAMVSFELQYSRKWVFLVINIVIPIVFLGMLNPVVFLLPHESGERVAFSVTILLSFTVFLNVVGDNVPKTSSPMPLLCHYVVIVLVTSGIITVLNTLFHRFYHARGLEPIPRWLQVVLCFSAVCARNKVKGTVGEDKNKVVDVRVTVKKDTTRKTPILWKEAIVKLDIISFILFFISAVTLALVYIIAMTTFQNDRLNSCES